jgi:hypothetical protein
MHKDVRLAVDRNKAPALFVIEPLHCSCSHRNLLVAGACHSDSVRVVLTFARVTLVAIEETHCCGVLTADYRSRGGVLHGPSTCHEFVT